MKIVDNSFSNLPDEFPDDLIDREWCINIHDQTPERLNERGGMDIMELLMNQKRMRLKELIDKYGFNYEPTQKEADELSNFLSK